MNYLLRLEPFASQHIRLQSGKFDHPGRLWSSIPEMVRCFYSDKVNLEEAIPELFTFPYLVKNHNDFDLGVHERQVNHVELPKWARNEYHFAAVQMSALESPSVSAHRHEWIDLIFGVYRCEQSKFTMVVPFYYPEFSCDDEECMEQAREWDRQFGSVPMQVLFENHPPKFDRPMVCVPSTLPRAEGSVTRIRKQVIATETSVIDYRSGVPTTLRLPNLGDLWAVSRSLGLAVFGTGSDLFVLFSICRRARLDPHRKTAHC
jgi:hypothetical protein